LTPSIIYSDTVLPVEDLSNIITHIESIEFNGDEQEGVYWYTDQGTGSARILEWKKRSNLRVSPRRLGLRLKK
jgi:hypothetical protein